VPREASWHQAVMSPLTITIGGMTVHLTHWGAFEAVSDGERLTEVRPWRGDPEPMPQIGNVASAQHHPARIALPHVRKGAATNRSCRCRGTQHWTC